VTAAAEPSCKYQACEVVMKSIDVEAVKEKLIAAGAPAKERLLVPAEKALMQNLRILAGKSTKDKVLIAAGVVFGLVAVRYLFLLPSWMKERRETRQYVAVNNLTPDRLVARCGPPVSDETKDLYPMIARDMTYNSQSVGTVVLKFSKTAEESSTWVFMAMQDPSGSMRYEAPEAQISVLSCLDSRK
jgi:hypothetical protein